MLLITKLMNTNITMVSEILHSKMVKKIKNLKIKSCVICQSSECHQPECTTSVSPSLSGYSKQHPK